MGVPCLVRRTTSFRCLEYCTVPRKLCSSVPPPAARRVVCPEPGYSLSRYLVVRCSLRRCAAAPFQQFPPEPCHADWSKAVGSSP